MKNLILCFLLLNFTSTILAQDGSFNLDKEYKISKSGTIELSSTDAKVFITGSNRTTAHVKIERNVISKGWTSERGEFSVEVGENNGNLTIRERQTSSNISVGYYREEYKIEIEAPPGVSLRVRGDDGDYFIKNINGSISLSLDDADAELSDCKGDHFNFRLDDGDIRMDKGRGTLEIDGDDADIEIY